MSLYLAVLSAFFYFVCIRCIYSRNRRNLLKSIKHLINASLSSETKGAGIRALIVTAHPDDECMFFAPTIIQLVALNANVHLLCLSQGNYYNQGALRKQELLRSCALLGIPDFKITILDHRSTAQQRFISAQVVPAQFSTNCATVITTWSFPDDPKAEWNISLVSTVIMNHIESHAFNLVLTFDGRGVSSHANHIAIHKAVSHLALTGQVPNDCCFLKLVTVGLFRKYMSFLELPLSWLMPSSLFCCVGLHGYRLAKEAMFCHRTQLLWFRYLYVTFSRYICPHQTPPL
ncbi:N-acetylglucosaminyl-phosphatidylinositol de-N-acetylase isoform X2 [Takifugu flavidus]|uniref:N-acetylglucosaminyl-phosphatidylinositol de-N-acetylase isoform X2 n=1 Tax=Takifugu flavidus TaxID=433684 RepID=UPI002544557C|nr:N-acetylglucosaminyl-phosphatidylinositol de-N-acetylase isoform X2 [Takifugu flavidus]